ncbi:MAG: hypothetical protein HYX60_09135, partial [Legionella longbeachae]|nr:hypothetical protein [Legionella longbeachae]
LKNTVFSNKLNPEGFFFTKESQPLNDYSLSIRQALFSNSVKSLDKYTSNKIQKKLYSTNIIETKKNKNLTETKAITLIQKEGLSGFLSLTSDLMTEKLCLIFLCSRDGSLSKIPFEKRTHTVCLQAVILDGFELGDVPPLERSDEIILAAMNQNDGVFKLLSDNEKTESVYIVKINANPEIIKKIPVDKITLNMAISVVQIDPTLITEIPAILQKKVIESIGFKNMLTCNYNSLSFLNINDDKFNAARDELLLNTKYLLVSDQNSCYEVKDACHFYANLPTYANQTVHVYSHRIKTVLDDLPKNTSQSIELVLIDHTTPNSEEIAGLMPQEISKLIAEYQIIDSVILFGCNTAKVRILNQEKAIERISKTMQINNDDYGLVLLSKKPTQEISTEIVERIGMNKCYILTKEKYLHDYHYYLTLLESKDNKIQEESFHLTEEDFKSIEKSMNSGKILAFPKNENEKYFIRNKTNPMKKNEVTTLFYATLPEGHEVLHTRAIIDNNESNKIEDSLMKKVFDKINDNPNIKRDLNLTGYTKSIYLDIPKQSVLCHNESLYKSDYESMFFFSKQDPIDRKRLKSAISKKNQIDEKNMQAESTEYDVITLEVRK